ncbi:MAG: histidine--tRNA ligase [Candidatus Sumerlaeaceae bacterium]
MSVKSGQKLSILQAIKGMEDLLPTEAAKYDYVESTARNLFPLYGYGEIRTPILESTELFARSVGDASDVVVSKQMYTFVDAGERSNTMRPEGTAGVVRALIEHGTLKEQPQQKLFYIGPMFRYEKPQKGRLRQFHQIGTEFFGVAHPGADVEIIALCDTYLRKLGFRNIVTKVNNIGCRECRKAYNAMLRETIQSSASVPPAASTSNAALAQSHAATAAPSSRSAQNQWCEQCLERARVNPMRVFDCKVARCNQLVAALPRMKDYLCEACRTHFAGVVRLLDAAKIPYELDESLVRGFDYYTRTVFEVMQGNIGAQSAILGGGRYDYLVEELGGPPTPGVGFGIGIERLLLAMEANGLTFPALAAPEIYALALDEESIPAIFAYVQRAREGGKRVAFDCQPRSAKAGLKAANRVGAQVAVIVGSDEVIRGVAQRKNLSTGEQTEVPLAEL